MSKYWQLCGWTLLLSLLLVACTGDPTPSNLALSSAGKITNYTRGAGTIRVVTGKSLATASEIGTGTVSATGEVAFNISETSLNGSLLTMFFSNSAACTLTISDLGAKAASASVVVMVGGDDIGTLLEAVELSSTRAAFVGRSYLDRNVSASGTCFGNPSTRYDLKLEKGWNLVFLADAVGGGLTFTTELAAPSPEDTQFLLFPTSSSQGVLGDQKSIHGLLEQLRH